MRKKTKMIALGGILTALGVVIMSLGGVIPLATFCSPALASLLLIPLLHEYGIKWALAMYAAVAALSLLFSPDKESALLFAFLGYYPAIRPALNRMTRPALRVAVKLLILNAAAGAMLATAFYVLNMQSLLAEYAEMTAVLLAGFAVLVNITFLVYDRMLEVMTRVYVLRLRKKLF